MILLLAVVAGLLAGLARSQIMGKPYHPAGLVHSWLAVAAILPQLVSFFFEPTARAIPNQVASICLVISQVGLLVFVVLNLKQPGMPILGLGLVMNLAVIVANGGWMPISPEIAAQLRPDHPQTVWETGLRLGWSKDILLARSQMNLGGLSDCYLLPSWFPGRVAFSPGDVLIAIGAFSLLWQGEPARRDH